MKVDMSPKAIENRLKLVGELTKACLLIRQSIVREKDKVASRNPHSTVKKYENDVVLALQNGNANA